MNSIHHDGTVTSDCCYCAWVSDPQPCVHDAMTAAGAHMRSCEARRDYYATLQTRCRGCGGLNGSHGTVHVRHDNGGGHNEPCMGA